MCSQLFPDNTNSGTIDYLSLDWGITMVVQVLEKNELTLLATDRCDRCGSRAYLVAMKGKFELMFCAHHGTEFVTGLKSDGWDIHDERDVLTN